MRVYSWNVMGIKATKFGEFLEDFGKEVSWDVIVLQEFTAAKDVEVFMNKTARFCILFFMSIKHRHIDARIVVYVFMKPS